MAYKAGLGYQINRGAEVIAITATPGDPFFTVAGGLCLITGLLGVCAIAAGGANTLSFELNPDDATGANSPLTLAADLGTLMTAGDVCTLVGAPGTALLAGHVPLNVMGSTLGKGLVVNSGVIGLVATAAVMSMRWILWWIPIDDGATIVNIP